MSKTLIVKGGLKELCRTKEGKRLSMSNELLDALTARVERIMERACERAILNERKTVMPKDL